MEKSKLKLVLIFVFWIVFTLSMSVVTTLTIHSVKEDYNESTELKERNNSLIQDSIVTHKRLDSCALRDKKRGLDYTDTYD